MQTKYVSMGILSFLLILSISSEVFPYNFTHFGGRRGRAGVTDSLYQWNKGASGGTLTWFFERDQLTVDPGNGSGHATVEEFNAMETLIQPNLNKWGLWIDLLFSKAANRAAADVVVEFETNFDVTGRSVGSNPDAAAAQYGHVSGNTLNDAEIGLYPSDHWADDQNDFAYTILHEWGHILGLGDLYSADHNGAAPGGLFEGEDFIDHGLPSIDPLKTTGKGDNVMDTRGITELDNDEITGAQWLWGALGSDSIVTGNLKALAPGFNANETDDHHGPNTWHYRGTSSVAAPGGGTTVTIWAVGATAARDVGPGDWNWQIFPNQVIFTSAAGYAGNFEFEIDSPNPEGMINARIFDNTPTDFTAFPQTNGRQTFPVPKIYGPVPEPSTMLLLGSGLAGIIGFGRKRLFKKA